MKRLLIPLAALLATIPLAAIAQAPAPARESPFISMLRKADVSATGKVARSDVDAPLKAVQDDQAAKLRSVWSNTRLFLRLPPERTSVTTREVIEATKAAIDEADTDRDGRVTPAEMEAYAAKEPDPARRAAVTERLRAPDMNGDGTVDAEERRFELDPAEAGKDVGEGKLNELIEATRLWQTRSIDSLFARFAGEDGRIDIADMDERLRKAAEAARK
jgi:hypothetical protein